MEACVLDRLQVPPVAEDESVIVAPPSQTVAGPLIAPAKGIGLTVTSIVSVLAPQAFVAVYESMVVPVAIPLTRPPEVTLMRPVLVAHVPPDVPPTEVKVTVSPTQTDVGPVTVPAASKGSIVIARLATAVPQPFVTE